LTRSSPGGSRPVMTAMSMSCSPRRQGGARSAAARAGAHRGRGPEAAAKKRTARHETAMWRSRLGPPRRAHADRVGELRGRLGRWIHGRDAQCVVHPVRSASVGPARGGRTAAAGRPRVGRHLPLPGVARQGRRCRQAARSARPPSGPGEAPEKFFTLNNFQVPEIYEGRYPPTAPGRARPPPLAHFSPCHVPGVPSRWSEAPWLRLLLQREEASPAARAPPGATRSTPARGPQDVVLTTVSTKYRPPTRPETEGERRLGEALRRRWWKRRG
jgi:hypothetical protein